MDAYADSHNQILFTGSLMDGPASQWYESLIDPSIYDVPSTYTFDTFIQELDDFFGGGVTLHLLGLLSLVTSVPIASTPISYLCASSLVLQL